MKIDISYSEIEVVFGGGKGTCRCYNERGTPVISTGFSYGDSCYNFCCDEKRAYSWSLIGSKRIVDIEGLCSYGKPGHSNKGWDPVTDTWNTIKKRLL